MPRTERRLSAILHADLAGFVRLVESQEELTFEHLRSARDKIWQPAIEDGGGSLVHSAGDAMLAEFASAAAAVQAAIEIQERMARFNETIDEDQRLMFRIGVHLGEIIIDEAGHDIFGDGVNLAERIQVLAEPGGIAVSRAVRDVARLRDDYAYVDGGEHRAKHVSLPLHIYRVRARETRRHRAHPAGARARGLPFSRHRRHRAQVRLRPGHGRAGEAQAKRLDRPGFRPMRRRRC